MIVRTLAGDQATVLVVAGEIDMATAPILRRALESAALISPRLLVVDLSAVSFLACAGLTVLVAAHRGAGDRTCLRVVVGGRATCRPLVLTGVDQRLAVYGTRAHALTTPLPGSR